MKSMHTKGPWQWAASDIQDGRYSIHHNGPIAYCGDTTASPGDGEANARLISAAPDLLAACEAALAWISDPASFQQNHIDDVAAACEAAIAKARGE